MPVPPEAMRAHLRRQAGVLRAPLNHLQRVRPFDRAAAQPAAPPVWSSRGKQGAFRVGRQAGALYVFIRPRPAPYGARE